MPSVADSVDEIRSAIARLRSAAIADEDSRRLQTAEQLELRFAGIVSSLELRAAARDALRLYGGGMGAFQDAGSSATASAIAGLSEAPPSDLDLLSVRWRTGHRTRATDEVSFQHCGSALGFGP